MRIIDAHSHVHSPQWVKKPRSDDYLIEHFNVPCTEDKILANMEEAQIDKTVIFPMPSVEVNLDAANLYTVYASKLYPDKLIPFTIIDDAPEKWLQLGVRGFKEHTYGQRIQRDKEGNDIFSARYKSSYKVMEESGAPLLLHAGENRVGRIKDDILRDAPDLQIILAHLGADFPASNNYVPEDKQVKSTLEALRECAGVYFDITAITNPDLIKQAVQIVGAKRLIFGSDFPCERPIESIARLQGVSLTHRQKQYILYDNITKLIGGMVDA